MTDTIREGSVLIVLSTLEIGGSEGKFVKFAGALAARGRKVTLAYMNPPLHLLPRIDPAVTVVPLHRRGRFSFRALCALIATIRRCDASAVIAVNLYASLYVALARLVRRFRFIASMNTTEFIDDRQARQMHLYRHVLRRADLIVFGAETQRRLWTQRYGLGGRGLHTTVLYNGVDADRFAPVAEPSAARALPHVRYVIGTVGRLRPEKAHAHLIRVTAQLRASGLDVGALIVGGGSERAALEAEIRQCGLARHVVLAGETDDVRPYLAQMDLFVLPSIGVETFSNAVLEAMAMGIPVVSSTAGGMEELLRWGGGVTYAPGDLPRLCVLLAGLLDDAGRRSEMARMARQVALERFRWHHAVERLATLLDPAPEPLDPIEDEALTSRLN
jgi:glycosyltransferase involved in cell wall biosynthesis